MDTLPLSSALCRAGGKLPGNIPARPGAARERSAGTELHLGVRERLASAPLVPPPKAQGGDDHGQPSPRQTSEWFRLGALGAQDEGQPGPAPSASLETQPVPEGDTESE